MDKKGHTILEMILLIAISGMFLYNALNFPLGLLHDHAQFTIDNVKINDIILLRTAINNDLKVGFAEKKENNILQLGNSLYYFNDVVTRENSGERIVLTHHPYEFQYENNIIKIYNDEVNLEYTVTSSFSNRW